MRKRIIALLLALAMCLALAPGALAAAEPGGKALTNLAFTEVEDGETHRSDPGEPDVDGLWEEDYEDGDTVRVSIALEEKSALAAGYSTFNAAGNTALRSYRESLKQNQAAVTAAIEKQVLKGRSLDVVWNLTLVANVISANVSCSDIDAIAALPGVAQVVVETQARPMVVSADETDPQMYTSSSMIGSAAAWTQGYTGAGSRVAILDTGTDINHQSFDPGAFLYSLEKQAEGRDDPDGWLESLNLLDESELADLIGQLNIFDILRSNGWGAEDLYCSEKLPFGFNYADATLDITHDNDNRGEHGSHVAGIAAANAYIPDGNGYTSALESVYVQGVAPDAQILTLKVFGQTKGAYESDYMAAIEDAIVLGADVINLSLGTIQGFSRSQLYEDVMNELMDSDTVVTVSAGNSGSWADSEAGETGLLYADDVNLTTIGAPGSYTNALTVASVDNQGGTDCTLKAGGELFFYTEGSKGRSVPFTALAGEQGYVFLDGYGSVEDFAAVGGALAGKVAVCSRGGGIGFGEKARNAVDAGAIGVIIYNNTSEALIMDLSEYPYEKPCVSVTMEVGALLRSAADPVMDEEGNILCYTGTLTVSDSVFPIQGSGEPPVMSSFSSWGVPGSLELKPEITAPGGNIYSVDGSDLSGTAYENMSGTSMASPQVAGMVAVLAQYLRENDLTGKTGLSARQLATSLLMSTAAPLTDANSGSYYPVLQQGAGLANVGNAIRSDSYILMNGDATGSAGDGKVKVELGDDPAREGIYSFAFTLCNLSNLSKDFTLSSAFFTQGVYEGRLDTRTVSLSTDVVFAVDGQVCSYVSLLACDADQDGDTDVDDAKLILEYVAGNVDAIAPVADLDGDGAVTSYDAYRLLASLETEEFSVAAGDSAVISVTIRLSASDRAFLDANFPNGNYVEGYVFVEPAQTDDGELIPAHSIPVLGFYGNWSDPSMWERASYVDTLFDRSLTPYTGVLGSNYLSVRYPGQVRSTPWIANPYLLAGVEDEDDALLEDTYPAGKEALSSQTTLADCTLSLIRHAAAIMSFVADGEGNIVETGSVGHHIYGTNYYTDDDGSGSWINVATRDTINRTVASYGFAEGDVFTIGYVAVPEYYETDGELTAAQLTELMRSGALGEGAYQTYTFTVDDTKPAATAIAKDEETGALVVTVEDNRYVAAVLVLDVSGATLLAASSVEADQAGQSATVTLDLSGAVMTKNCKVVVADYAGNERTYDVVYNENMDYTGKMYGFTNSNYRGSGNRWMEIDADTLYYGDRTTYYGTQTVAEMDFAVTAAEYVGGYVYMAADDGWLYAAQQGEWTNAIRVGRYAQTDSPIRDMAFNYADGQLYALGTENRIYTVNLTTGELTLAYTVAITNPNANGAVQALQLLTLAIDGDGNFYSVNNGVSQSGGGMIIGGGSSYASKNWRAAYLYSWSADDADADGQISIDPVVNTTEGYLGSNYDGYSSIDAWQSMAWDHGSDTLYWAGAYSSVSSYNVLYTVDTATGKAAKASSYVPEGGYGSSASVLQCPVSGLYIVPGEAGQPVTPAQEATGISLSDTELTLLTGTSYQLTAQLSPWTLEDQEVLWTSSDETVAAVTGGLVLAQKAGSATITATTAARPGLSAVCQVTVEDVPAIVFSALMYDGAGQVAWADFDTAHPAGFTLIPGGSSPEFLAGGLLEDTLYVHDGSHMYGVDADSFAVTDHGVVDPYWQWSDAAPAPATEDGLFGMMVGICEDGVLLGLLNVETGMGNDNLTTRTTFNYDPMAAIAYVENTTYDYYGECDARRYYVITEGGELWEALIYGYWDGADAVYQVVTTDLGPTGLDLTNAPYPGSGAYASMLCDEETGYLVLSSYEGGSAAQLYLIDPATQAVRSLGDFGGDVWPVISLYQYDRITELTVKVKPARERLYAGDTAELSAGVYPTTFEQGVTWTSSDPTVATVDDNGVVTGVGAGTAVITATSVAASEGVPASASCTITVEPLTTVEGAYVNAYVTREDGSGAWVKLDLDGSLTSTVLSEDETARAYTGAGAHNGKIYATRDSAYVEIDPANGFAETVGGPVTDGFRILDAATAPAEEMIIMDWETEEESIEMVFDMVVYVSDGEVLTFMPDCRDDTNTVGISIPYYEASAIAYQRTVNASPDEPTARAYWWMLGADGYLWEVTQTVSGWDGYPYYYAPSIDGRSAVDLGITFADRTKLSMVKIEDGTNYGLLISDASDGVTLYYYDLNTQTFGKVGRLDGLTDLVGLYTDAEAGIASGQNAGAVPVESTGASGGFTPMSVPAAQAEPKLISRAQSAGGFAPQSVSAQARIQPDARSAAESVAQLTVSGGTGGRVTANLEVTTVTNAVAEIRYDPRTLTFSGVSQSLPHGAYLSCRVDAEAGVVRLAYAGKTVATGTLAQIVFTYAASSAGITSMETLVSERNDDFTQTAETLNVRLNAYITGGGIGTGKPDEPGDEPSVRPWRFIDVPEGGWYYDAVYTVADRGLMIGTAEMIFSPDMTLRRDMMMTVLARLDGVDTSTGSTWYEAGVNWAVEMGVSDGTNGARAISRQEAVTMLMRYAELRGLDVSARADLGAFRDGEAAADWAKDAMSWAVSAGILQGKGNDTLDPCGTAARKEAAAILSRFLSLFD